MLNKDNNKKSFMDVSAKEIDIQDEEEYIKEILLAVKTVRQHRFGSVFISFHGIRDTEAKCTIEMTFKRMLEC